MSSELTRRHLLQAGAATAGLAAISVSPTSASVTGNRAPEWLTLLGHSEKGARDYAPRIEGEVPGELRGALYRNGPGLFERGGVRKPHLLDGDGLVQRLSFGRDGVRYRNAFVRTRKFEEEQAAGKFLYRTWSQRAPGGMFANLGGGNFLSQAGVTVYPFGGKLYAFDEVSPPYAVEPERLATIGEAPLGRRDLDFAIKAHTKIDPVTGEWLLAGISHGRNMKIHAIVHAADGTLTAHHVVESPRQVYIHDFFATENYFVFLLHPMWFSPWGMLAGFDTYIESLSWRGGDGNEVLVVPRAGGPVRRFEAKGAFMWHALNAYERGQEIVADFAAYDMPDHFNGPNAMFYALMRGEMGVGEEKGKLYRYVIDLGTARLREEIVSVEGHEFPMVDPRSATRPHRVGYFATGGRGPLTSGLKRLDYDTGKAEVFDFGARTVVGEPVFAPKPNGKADEGWLIAECLDGESRKTFFALFDAASVGAGPVAKIWLEHHVPINFHGAWLPA
jgi:all-trans-8'-apo-beta-carotenal 15,15'-oxygenase